MVECAAKVDSHFLFTKGEIMGAQRSTPLVWYLYVIYGDGNGLTANRNPDRTDGSKRQGMA
jgi:hypothetical protein